VLSSSAFPGNEDLDPAYWSIHICFPRVPREFQEGWQGAKNVQKRRPGQEAAFPCADVFLLEAVGVARVERAKLLANRVPGISQDVGDTRLLHDGIHSPCRLDQ
jgi:hypothetical protein